MKFFQLIILMRFTNCITKVQCMKVTKKKVKQPDSSRLNFRVYEGEFAKFVCKKKQCKITFL